MSLKSFVAVLAIAILLGLSLYLIETTISLEGIPSWLVYITLALIAGLSNTLFSDRDKPRSKKSPRQARPRQQGSAPARGPRQTGVVKWFSTRKGFGFITRHDDEDIFVHFRGISGDGRRALKEGQKVSFTVSEGDRGLQAENVMVEA